MRKMLPFCCLEMKPLFNMEAFFNLPRCFAQWAVTLCGEEGGLQLVWAVGKTGAAGSCRGHLRGQLDLGTARSTLVFNTDGFCRREFLFSLLPWCHEMQFWETLSFALFLPTQLLPGEAVRRSNTEGIAASVIYRSCSILVQGTHI